MKKIKVKELGSKDFSGYGQFVNALEPNGFKVRKEPTEFFRDLIDCKLGYDNFVSFSLFRGLKQKVKPVLRAIGYHSRCEEMKLPLDDDYVLCSTKATPPNTIPIDEFESFRIPKGTMIVLKPGIWHGGLFLYNCDLIYILVAFTLAHIRRRLLCFSNS